MSASATIESAIANATGTTFLASGAVNDMAKFTSAIAAAPPLRCVNK